MIIIGLTGGIGSGKSTFLSWFSDQGIPIFESDKVAKELLNTSLKPLIRQQFGNKLYKKGHLDTQALASLVFENNSLLKKLNTIVHPAVADAFELFIKTNNQARLVVKEAAILFETGAYKRCDFTILICAPKEARIARVMQRDSVSRKAVLNRMRKQWPDSKKIPLADAIIENKDLQTALKQLESLVKAHFDEGKD